MVLTCKFLKTRNDYTERPAMTGLFLLFYFIFNGCVFSANYKPKITNIDVIGLDKTLQYVVDREIHHSVDVYIDSSIAALDRNRIFNLGLFEDVAWRLVPLENGDAILQYIMVESINKTPPLLFPSYDEEKGWSLNALLMIKNLQGRNQTLEIFAGFGGQQKIQLLFSDPWLFGDHVSLSTYLESNSYDHLFLDRIISISSLKISIGKWYGEKIKLRFSPALIKKSFTNSINTLSYKFFTPELKIELDTRDIFWNPTKGSRIIQSIIPMLGNNKFTVWNQSYSFFLSAFDNIVLGFNTTIQRKIGHKNDVWLSYFGNSYNIRGWDLPDKNQSFDNYRFGHEFLFSSFELRKLFLNNNGARFGYKKGICIVAFTDIGAINKNWKTISRNSMLGGAGFGIRLPIPILQSVRIDLGWGFKNKKFNKTPTFHFAVQQKF